MLVSNNYRNYDRCNVFVEHHIEHRYEFEKNNPKYIGKICKLFSNHLFQFKSYYQRLERYYDEQKDFTLKKFYEGKVKVFMFYLEHLSFKRNVSNRLEIDFETTKKRVNDYMYKVLAEAEEYFENDNRYLGSMYMGQYFALKEIIRVIGYYTDGIKREVVY